MQLRVPQQSTRPRSAAAEGPYHYYCDKNPYYKKCYLMVDRPLCCSYRTNVSRGTNVSRSNRSKECRNRNPKIGIRKKGFVKQGVTTRNTNNIIIITFKNIIFVVYLVFYHHFVTKTFARILVRIIFNRINLYNSLSILITSRSVMTCTPALKAGSSLFLVLLPYFCELPSDCLLSLFHFHSFMHLICDKIKPLGKWIVSAA